MKTICSTETSGPRLATLVAGIIDAQGNFCGTGGCTFMSATVSLKIRPKKPNPLHISAFSQAKAMKSKEFDVVISVPKGCVDISIPAGVNSLQLSAKSRKNCRRSAVSLYQFACILARGSLSIHADDPTEHFGGPEAAEELKREVMKKIAGAFYPKISEYEESVSDQERAELCALVRRGDCYGFKDIQETELESYLAFPPNSKQANRRNSNKADMAVKYSELQAADEPEGASDAGVSVADVFDAENAPEKHKKEKKPKKEAAGDDASGLEGEEKPLKPKKEVADAETSGPEEEEKPLKPKKRGKKLGYEHTSNDVVTEKFATSEDPLELEGGGVLYCVSE